MFTWCCFVKFCTLGGKFKKEKAIYLWRNNICEKWVEQGISSRDIILKWFGEILRFLFVLFNKLLNAIVKIFCIHPVAISGKCIHPFETWCTKTSLSLDKHLLNVCIKIRIGDGQGIIIWFEYLSSGVILLAAA